MIRLIRRSLASFIVAASSSVSKGISRLYKRLSTYIQFTGYYVYRHHKRPSTESLDSGENEIGRLLARTRIQIAAVETSCSHTRHAGPFGVIQAPESSPTVTLPKFDITSNGIRSSRTPNIVPTIKATIIIGRLSVSPAPIKSCISFSQQVKIKD